MERMERKVLPNFLGNWGEPFVFSKFSLEKREKWDL